MPKNKKKQPAKPTTALTVTVNYIETQKFKDWCRYFFDRGNKETYGNATKAAIKAYNSENYWTAANLGYRNVKKVENLRLMIADQEGFGIADMMKIGFSKMLAGEFGDWEKMMVRLGHFEPDPANINATQNNFNFNFANMGEAIAASRKERGLTP